MLNKKTLGISAAIAASALVLAACGSSTSGNDGHDMSTMTSTTAATAQPAAHNDADVTFAQGMIPHHQQAVTMAQLAASHAAGQQVKDLAARIQQAQDPEIQKMTGWLNQWGAPVSGSAMPPMSGMPGMDHGSMAGMMSDADMQKLAQAGGADFDKMFLQMMISHHQGAVDMARTELGSGSNAEAKALAQNIVDSQTVEINEMQQLLAS
ncbi:DUF305 domain-containing protein [Amycolatopsis taiwanensis]|uniref:DUF305 domain-containing protein n=1 Tax=Amycolatopsis taiwanensis TaxID=342230 RepID=A0A9W6VKZ7_9PSEU|nr:DUF305 domain-containing protein [Amycolatopsis taiwanensis]GLY70942.1 hypothetical protein Atai01_75610 [Amycolatopsis taiwanensis]